MGDKQSQRSPLEVEDGLKQPSAEDLSADSQSQSQVGIAVGEARGHSQQKDAMTLEAAQAFVSIFVMAAFDFIFNFVAKRGGGNYQKEPTPIELAQFPVSEESEDSSADSQSQADVAVRTEREHSGQLQQKQEDAWARFIVILLAAFTTTTVVKPQEALELESTTYFGSKMAYKSFEGLSSARFFNRNDTNGNTDLCKGRDRGQAKGMTCR
ncbi:MAG: hypothetical protein V3V61_08020 [Gammaproteobacteria bacterium]